MNVLIIGATSAIAQATARCYAAEGARLFLAARDPRRLAMVAEDLAVRGAAAVRTQALDLDRIDDHPALVEAAAAFLGRMDLALIAHGTLPEQAACEADPALTLRALHTNAAGPIALLNRLAPVFEAQGGGTLAAISSVAGDRGRRSNYAYGAAKAALSTYLAGLRHRLAGSGVQVLTIKPGFVDTPMTADFPKGPLWVGPEVIARGICRAVARRRAEIYLPWFWRPVMALIRAIPEPLFQRLNL